MEKKEIYKFPLRLKKKLKKPLKKIADDNSRSLNTEINVAIESYISLNNEKPK